MNFERDDCLIDSLSNTNRASIVRLSSLRAKFANGAKRKKIFFLFFYFVYGSLFPVKKCFSSFYINRRNFLGNLNRKFVNGKKQMTAFELFGFIFALEDAVLVCSA